LLRIPIRYKGDPRLVPSAILRAIAEINPMICWPSQRRSSFGIIFESSFSHMIPNSFRPRTVAERALAHQESASFINRSGDLRCDSRLVIEQANVAVHLSFVSGNAYHDGLVPGRIKESAPE